MSYSKLPNPIETLHRNINKRVIMRVKRNQRSFKGVLKSFDPHLNTLLEDCTFIYSVKNEDGTFSEKTEEFKQIIVRGDNIIYIGLE